MSDEQDPATVAHGLVAAAEVLAGSFDAVEGEQWQRRGGRSDGSWFTVESLACYLVHHPIHHIWDVAGR